MEIDYRCYVQEGTKGSRTSNAAPLSWSPGLNEGGEVHAIYINFFKAFDKIMRYYLKN